MQLLVIGGVLVLTGCGTKLDCVRTPTGAWLRVRFFWEFAVVVFAVWLTMFLILRRHWDKPDGPGVSPISIATFLWMLLCLQVIGLSLSALIAAKNACGLWKPHGLEIHGDTLNVYEEGRLLHAVPLRSVEAVRWRKGKVQTSYRRTLSGDIYKKYIEYYVTLHDGQEVPLSGLEITEAQEVTYSPISIEHIIDPLCFNIKTPDCPVREFNTLISATQTTADGPNDTNVTHPGQGQP